MSEKRLSYRKALSIARTLEREHLNLFTDISKRLERSKNNPKDIPAIYSSFKDTFSGDELRLREKFICMIAGLYSPETLTGGLTLAQGVRSGIKAALGLKSERQVSTILTVALMRYKNKRFKNDVDLMIKMAKDGRGN